MLPPSLPFAARVAISAVVAVAALTMLADCAAPGAIKMSDVPSTGDAQRSWFEAQATHPRAILLLSPV